MNTLKRNFTWLIVSLFALVFVLVAFSMAFSSKVVAAPADDDFPMPVSINALMVTLIDHSAHYIWDYGALEDENGETIAINDEEWQAVEYYAVQLAAAGPLITLGGTGRLDNSWVASPLWTQYAREMSTAAEMALGAGRNQDKQLLVEAGNRLVESCEGCHDAFKLEVPTEGIWHEPKYDHLYHLFER